MNANTWINEIMSLKISNLQKKDISKILILIYIIQNKKFNVIIELKELEHFLYCFYADNNTYSKMSNSSIIRNISKYNYTDLEQNVKMSLSEWKNDFPNGCMDYNDSEIFISISDVNESIIESSMMIANMLFTKATNANYNYDINLKELDNLNEYNLDYINSSRMINRVLEFNNYCCCCDEVNDLRIINISNNKKNILNPCNYVAVCNNHYQLFLDDYYYFNNSGKIVIKKEHHSLNSKMHLSISEMKRISSIEV